MMGSWSAGGPRPFTPCWHCHWFGYLLAENPHGACVKPTNSPLATAPREGCAFWTREPGADEGGAPRPLEPGAPARRAIDRERARLVKIQELAERARLPYGIHAEVSCREGLVVVGWIRPDRQVDMPALEAEIERLGINAAIRAGRL